MHRNASRRLLPACLAVATLLATGSVALAQSAPATSGKIPESTPTTQEPVSHAGRVLRRHDCEEASHDGPTQDASDPRRPQGRRGGVRRSGGAPRPALWRGEPRPYGYVCKNDVPNQGLLGSLLPRQVRVTPR